MCFQSFAIHLGQIAHHRGLRVADLKQSTGNFQVSVRSILATNHLHIILLGIYNAPTIFWDAR